MKRYYVSFSYLLLLLSVFVPVSSVFSQEKSPHPSDLSQLQVADTGQYYLRLGEKYEEGQGVIKDLSKAKENYQKAANRNIAQAQYKLGFFYLKGIAGEQDMGKARQYLKLSAEQGNEMASDTLGNLYLRGIGVPEDKEKALFFLKKAEKAGNQEASKTIKEMSFETDSAQPMQSTHTKAQEALLQYRLGILMQAANRKKSLEYFERAALLGNDKAQLKAGTLYMDGEDGIAYDPVKARAYFEMAALQANTKGQTLIGLMYCTGEGGEKNLRKGRLELIVAAGNGDADAQVIVGRMYEQGKGGSQSKEEARHFYKLAADQGNQEAQEALKRLDLEILNHQKLKE